jgi:hypothetical protein
LVFTLPEELLRTRVLESSIVSPVNLICRWIARHDEQDTLCPSEYEHNDGDIF